MLAAKRADLPWAIDDAAKQAVNNRKLARGMKPAGAAAETLREMVDCRHRSQATKAANMVAPLATFRSRIPAADRIEHVAKFRAAARARSRDARARLQRRFASIRAFSAAVRLLSFEACVLAFSFADVIVWRLAELNSVVST